MSHSGIPAPRERGLVAGTSGTGMVWNFSKPPCRDWRGSVPISNLGKNPGVRGSDVMDSKGLAGCSV